MTIETNGSSSGSLPLLAKHFTSSPDKRPRLRVDAAQTGFFEGREFRSYYEISLAAGTSVYLRFTANCEFILFEQTLTMTEGRVKVTVSTAGTPAGTYNTELPIIGKNRMLERLQPYYEAQNTIATGGTHSGGTVLEVFYVYASTATAQQSTVGGGVSDERGIPEGTYYIKLENMGAGAATGIYNLWWEERV